MQPVSPGSATFEFISYELSMLTGEASLALKKCSKPVIAMINGAAAGGGCGIALGADFRIMSESSYLLTAFSNVALPGDTGCIYHLHQIVGLAKTAELMAFSAPVYGEEALYLGLATRLAAEGSLLEETQTFAEKLLRRPLGAIAMQKQLYYEVFYHDYMAYRRKISPRRAHPPTIAKQSQPSSKDANRSSIKDELIPYIERGGCNEIVFLHNFVAAPFSI